MSFDAANGLVTRYGQAIGLPAMRLDEEGYAGLAFGEGQALHLQFAPEDDALMVYAKAGSFEEDAAEAALAAICTANLFWVGTPGVTVGATPENGDVFVASRTPVQVLDDAAFTALLERMMDETEAWASRLRALNAGEGLAGPAAPPPPPPLSGGFGMIRG